jgi:transcriptional regulator with XRE-family HTH domain
MKIRAIREERRLKQRDLAIKLKMSHAYLSNLEAGKVNVSLYTLRRIAKALKVRVADLVADE